MSEVMYLLGVLTGVVIAALVGLPWLLRQQAKHFDQLMNQVREAGKK